MTRLSHLLSMKSLGLGWLGPTPLTHLQKQTDIYMQTSCCGQAVMERKLILSKTSKNSSCLLVYLYDFIMSHHLLQIFVFSLLCNHLVQFWTPQCIKRSVVMFQSKFFNLLRLTIDWLFQVWQQRKSSSVSKTTRQWIQSLHSDWFISISNCFAFWHLLRLAGLLSVPDWLCCWLHSAWVVWLVEYQLRNCCDLPLVVCSPVRVSSKCSSCFGDRVKANVCGCVYVRTCLCMCRLMCLSGCLRWAVCSQ